MLDPLALYLSRHPSAHCSLSPRGGLVAPILLLVLQHGPPSSLPLTPSIAIKDSSLPPLRSLRLPTLVHAVLSLHPLLITYTRPPLSCTGGRTTPRPLESNKKSGPFRAKLAVYRSVSAYSSTLASIMKPFTSASLLTALCKSEITAHTHRYKTPKLIHQHSHSNRFSRPSLSLPRWRQ